jgi:cyanophycinase-like exopeptidase
MNLALQLAAPVTTLVLIGGGEFSFGETRPLDAAWLARMPADRRTVAFLPTASGSAEYAMHFAKYIRALDPSVDVINVPIYRGRDNRRQKSLRAILSAGAIYLGGGVSAQLLATLRSSPAETALRDAAAGGAVIAAIGASAAAFGVQVLDARDTAAPGLGWLEGTVIEAAFDRDADTRLRRLMSHPEAALGLGIPAKTALVISGDGTTEIMGDGQVAAFRKR